MKVCFWNCQRLGATAEVGDRGPKFIAGLRAMIAKNPRVIIMSEVNASATLKMDDAGDEFYEIKKICCNVSLKGGVCDHPKEHLGLAALVRSAGGSYKAVTPRCGDEYQCSFVHPWTDNPLDQRQVLELEMTVGAQTLLIYGWHAPSGPSDRRPKMIESMCKLIQHRIENSDAPVSVCWVGDFNQSPFVTQLTLSKMIPNALVDPDDSHGGTHHKVISDHIENALYWEKNGYYCQTLYPSLLTITRAQYEFNESYLKNHRDRLRDEDRINTYIDNMKKKEMKIKELENFVPAQYDKFGKLVADHGYKCFPDMMKYFHSSMLTLSEQHHHAISSPFGLHVSCEYHETFVPKRNLAYARELKDEPEIMLGDHASGALDYGVSNHTKLRCEVVNYATTNEEYVSDHLPIFLSEESL